LVLLSNEHSPFPISIFTVSGKEQYAQIAVVSDVPLYPKTINTSSID
jgi:hypothetical protein